MQWQRMVTRSINVIKKISVNNIKVCKLEVLWSHLFLMSKLNKQNYENLLGPLRYHLSKFFNFCDLHLSIQ